MPQENGDAPRRFGLNYQLGAATCQRLPRKEQTTLECRPCQLWPWSSILINFPALRIPR